jgi:hypothetical protein
MSLVSISFSEGYRENKQTTQTTNGFLSDDTKLVNLKKNQNEHNNHKTKNTNTNTENENQVGGRGGKKKEEE